MYDRRFVASIKSNNSFLREIGEQVFLPFNSEYSLYFKNLNSMRVAVAVSIDGTDVLDGNHIIINSNDIMELEGFMSGNSVKNKFKFVRRIKEIEEYRGIKPEDGLIVIKFWFEKQYPNYTIYSTPWYPYPYWDQWKPKPYPYEWEWRPDTITISNDPSWTSRSASDTNIKAVTSTFCNYVSNSSSDPGITVKGSKSNQNFTNTYFNYGEQEGTIIFKLMGNIDSQKEVVTPIFSETRMVCESCGLKNSSQYRFCPRCGTALF